MLTVFTCRLPDVPIIPLLYPNFGREERGSILFLNNAFNDIKEPFVAITEDPARADYLLLAHNYSALRKHPEYVHDFKELSEKHGKRVIVFWHGDSDAAVAIPSAIVFRTSLYGHNTRANEIAMPAYAEDLLGVETMQLRPKSVDPTVGFCGWADYRDLRNHLGSIAINALVELQTIIQRDPRVRSLRKGLSIRRDAIRILRGDKRVQINFIIRSSYSGHSDTIRLDPAQARNEYRDNLIGSDLALVVKGDGNYSYRFYEALSLGRVPLLIDTDCVLPLADRIDYDAFILRVPLAELPSLPDRVRIFWDALTPDQFASMQNRAREAYEQYLSVPEFLREAVRLMQDSITQTPEI